MKLMRVFSISFLIFATIVMCVPASAENQIDEAAMNQFVSTYSEAFLVMQQERSCCTGAGDPYALWEDSIDRIIAKFNAISTSGLPQDLVDTFEKVREKHIAEQEANRSMAQFIVKVQSEQPAFHVSFQQDPRPMLPPASVPEWDALVKVRDEASLQAVRSVNDLDTVVKKYLPSR